MCEVRSFDALISFEEFHSFEIALLKNDCKALTLDVTIGSMVKCQFVLQRLTRERGAFGEFFYSAHFRQLLPA